MAGNRSRQDILNDDELRDILSTDATLFAKGDVAAGQTDASLIAAVTGKKIRILSLVMVTGATATTSVFNTKPAGAGTAITCVFANGVNGGAALAFHPAGYFETASGEGLTVTTGAGSSTGYLLTYITL